MTQFNKHAKGRDRNMGAQSDSWWCEGEVSIDLSRRNEVMAVENHFDLPAVKIKHNKTSPNISFFSSCQWLDLPIAQSGWGGAHFAIVLGDCCVSGMALNPGEMRNIINLTNLLSSWGDWRLLQSWEQLWVMPWKWFTPSVVMAQFGGLLILIQFSRSIVSDSLRPHGLQHARLPCPSPTPRAYSNSHPLNRWCIQPSHPLSSPSPPTFNLSQHQGLFQWVSSHLVSKASISLLFLSIRGQTEWKLQSQKTTQTDHTVKLRAMLRRASQDTRVTVERSDKMWSTEEGMANHFSILVLRNPQNSIDINK